MIKRVYSVDQRERAMARALQVGPTAAGLELNIPPGTVAYWQSQARHKLAEPSTASVKPVPAKPTSLKPAPVESLSKPLPEVGAKKPAAKVAKVYTPSGRAQILECAADEGVSVAAERFGVSRFSIYEWRRRTKLHAEGQATESPVVGSDEDHVAMRDKRILTEWRAHPGLGPTQVRNQMRRAGLKVSVHTVRCVLEANGYVTPAIRREAVHDHLYEAVRPNHMWHLDFLHRYIHKQKIYILLLVDDYSRFLVGGALWDGERTAAVQETFLGAVTRHGKPEKAMSDGGSAFYSWRGIGAFTRLVEELEVDQLIAKIPQVNGKLEALNANIQKELFDKETFFDLGETQRRFTTWMHFYNFNRTHQSLGGLLVPADRYFGRADEVLAHIESGRSPVGVGEPVPPGERHLDLFRISTHRGEVEVYLMGQRLTVPLAKG